jgi:hypothetical protein
VTVEKPTYDLTIFRLHCGKLTLKIYTKGERVLRIKAMAHNVQELDCGRSVEKFPRIVAELKGILERFLQALSCIDQCFLADDTWERLPEPSTVGKARVGGIDFNKQRMRRVAEAVLALSWHPGGLPLRNWRIRWRGPTASRKTPTARAKPPTMLRSFVASRWWSGSARRVTTRQLRLD